MFGQHQRLEPLHPDKKTMWKREMNCLLSICDYIVEFVTTSQKLQDGTIVEVKTLLAEDLLSFHFCIFES